MEREEKTNKRYRYMYFIVPNWQQNNLTTDVMRH